MDYSKPWIFEEIARGREEAYFRQKDVELIEELRRRFRQRQERERFAEEVGVHDEQILRTFEELGFSRETVMVLHLVPLVQVAWSDRGVTEAERAKIHEVAALRGITPGTPAYLMLEKLLHKRPADRAFEGVSLASIRFRQRRGRCCSASRERLPKLTARLPERSWRARPSTASSPKSSSADEW